MQRDYRLGQHGWFFISSQFTEISLLVRKYSSEINDYFNDQQKISPPFCFWTHLNSLNNLTWLWKFNLVSLRVLGIGPRYWKCRKHLMIYWKFLQQIRGNFFVRLNILGHQLCKCYIFDFFDSLGEVFPWSALLSQHDHSHY